MKSSFKTFSTSLILFAIFACNSKKNLSTSEESNANNSNARTVADSTIVITDSLKEKPAVRKTPAEDNLLRVTTNLQMERAPNKELPLLKNKKK